MTEPLTGSGLSMQLDMERDNLPAMARRCVDEALGELGMHNLDEPNYEAGRVYG
jgi:hypothetical protein